MYFFNSGDHVDAYRAFAEQAADAVLAKLGVQRRGDTRALPIGGGRDYPATLIGRINAIEKLAAQHRISPGRAAVLFERYGTRAGKVAEYISAGPDEPSKSLPDWSEREVKFMFEHEKAVRIEDILLRRSNLAWLGTVTVTPPSDSHSPYDEIPRP